MLSELTPDQIGNFLQGVVLVVSGIGFVGFALRKKWREWREGVKTPRVDSDTFAKPSKTLPDPIVVQGRADTAAITGLYQDLSQKHALTVLALRVFRRRTWQLETSLKDNGLPVPAPFPDDADVLNLPLDQNGL